MYPLCIRRGKSRSLRSRSWRKSWQTGSDRGAGQSRTTNGLGAATGDSGEAQRWPETVSRSNGPQWVHQKRTLPPATQVRNPQWDGRCKVLHQNGRITRVLPNSARRREYTGMYSRYAFRPILLQQTSIWDQLCTRNIPCQDSATVRERDRSQSLHGWHSRLGKNKRRTRRSTEEGVGHHQTLWICNMPVPTTKEEVQRALGMVNYMAKFVPNLTVKPTPLRQLLLEKNDWQWEAEAWEPYFYRSTMEIGFQLRSSRVPWPLQKRTMLKLRRSF